MGSILAPLGGPEGTILALFRNIVEVQILSALPMNSKVRRVENRAKMVPKLVEKRSKTEVGSKIGVERLKNRSKTALGELGRPKKIVCRPPGAVLSDFGAILSDFGAPGATGSGRRAEPVGGGFGGVYLR